MFCEKAVEGKTKASMINVFLRREYCCLECNHFIVIPSFFFNCEYKITPLIDACTFIIDDSIPKDIIYGDGVIMTVETELSLWETGYISFENVGNIIIKYKIGGFNMHGKYSLLCPFWEISL